MINYEKVKLAVDIVVFSIDDNNLLTLLIKRAYKPFKNKWAIPGGFVRKSESLENAAKRELLEETNVSNVYFEQLFTFGELKRDPRGRVISVSYFALVPPSKIKNLVASADAKDVSQFLVYNLPELAFDHNKILDYATQRLKWKMEYTNVAFSLLNEEFTLTDMQKLYEIIFNKHFDKRNFRRKILSLNLIEPTGKKIIHGVQRPAATYRFITQKLSIVDMT